MKKCKTQTEDHRKQRLCFSAKDARMGKMIENRIAKVGPQKTTKEVWFENRKFQHSKQTPTYGVTVPEQSFNSKKWNASFQHGSSLASNAQNDKKVGVSPINVDQQRRRRRKKKFSLRFVFRFCLFVCVFYRLKMFVRVIVTFR